MKTDPELSDLELTASLGLDPGNPEDVELAKQTACMVLDENGQCIQMLPGPGELESAGLGTYAKQLYAAIGILPNIWRASIGRIKSNKDKQAILDTCHALKQELGKDWKMFYAKLLCGEPEMWLAQLESRGELYSESYLKEAARNCGWFFDKEDRKGILKYLVDKGEIDAKYIEELAERTGLIFNKCPLPMYETKIVQASKQSLASDGGLYRIMIEIRPREFKTFFAKKHGKKEEYIRTVAVQPLLAKITDKVSPIITKDNYNEITVEKYINGETLTHAFKRVSPPSMFTESIKDPVKRAEQEKLDQELIDQKRKRLLIPALDELIEISDAVEKNKSEFEFLKKRALGKGGKTFTEWFKEKYKPKDDNLIALVQKDITRYMDEEDLVFCHGDAHTDNVIEQLHQPKWIDWEYAGFSIPQMDLAKFLKKTGISKKAEEEIVRHVWKKRQHKDYGRFRNAYYKTKMLDCIISAAKYHKLSLASRKHRAEKQAQADIYFTDALRLIEEDQTIGERDRAELARRFEKDAKGRLNRLAAGDYEKFSKELDPYKSSSIENLGTPSIMEKYSKAPLSERIMKLFKKHRLKIAAGLAGVLLFTAGYAVNDHVHKARERERTKIERTSKYYADTDKNEKLMPLVTEYAKKYENVSEDELAAVINAAYNYNKRVAEMWINCLDYPFRAEGYKKQMTLSQLQDGLAEEQSFVKKEHLEDPENNVFAAAKRLSEMKKEFKNIEDAILAFYTNPEFVKKWKKTAKSYWDYSREEKFVYGPCPYEHKILTDMALAYLKK